MQMTKVGRKFSGKKMSKTILCTSNACKQQAENLHRELHGTDFSVVLAVLKDAFDFKAAKPSDLFAVQRN